MTQWTVREFASQPPILRVSDAEREQAAALLREHWLAGRLDATEFDERMAEAWAARTDRELAFALRELPATHRARVVPERGDPASAIASLVLGSIGVALFLVTFGFLSILALPLSVTAWALGRSARRRPGERGHGQATAGLVLGALGTALSMLFLSGCAIVLL